MHESDIKYQMLFNAIDEGFCIIEMIFNEDEKPVDYRFLEINPSFEKRTGLMNALGRRMKELCPEHEAYWFEIYGNVALTGQPVRFVNRAEQLHRWYDVYAFRVGLPENRQVAVLFNEVTDRKHAEEMLKKNEALLKVALKSVNMAVFNQDSDLRYTWMFHPQIGYTTDQVIGKTDIELLPKKAGQKVTKIKRTTLEKGVTGRSEIEVATENMTNYFDLVVEPCFNDDGRIVGITGASLDITERKKIEEKQRASESEFRSLFENSLVGITQTLPDGRLIRANFAMAKILGYRNVDELIDNYEELRKKIYVQPEERAGILELLKSEGRMEAQLFEMIHRNGHKIYVLIGARNILDSDGNLLYVQAEHLDVTERKLAESTLAESEAKFRSLFENSVVGISIARPGGGILQVNQAYARLYGYENPEHFRSEVSDPTVLFAHSEERGEVLRELKGKGFMKAKEFELIRRDGSHFFALVSASEVRDADGKLLYNQATHIDMTEQKKAESALRISNERRRLIMENSGLGIAYYSVDGKILMLNTVALGNLGGEISDYIGKSLTEVFGIETGQVYIDRLRSAAISKNPLVFEDYVELDGKPGWYLSTHSRIITRNGVVDGVQVIADNITELKNAEIKLKESQKKYRNLSHHLEEILEKERSTIAMNLHDDLGQKLTALDLDLAWIKGRIGVQSDSVKKKLSEMSLIINEIVESIKEISSFLRPSILFDLGLFPAIISLLDKFQKSSGIICHFKSGSEEVNIDDRISLIIYRVLQEALTNIARHSEATTVETTIIFADNRIDISIIDNGKGIDDEMVNSITSMGITGIKERVRSVQGTFQINGEKDSGTSIMVSIPLNQFDND